MTDMFDEYNECRLCPRSCGVNRNDGKRGYCGMSGELRLARAALHMWEEPCISGSSGSGTVFFCGCGLKCVYCQNHNIANDNSVGKAVTVERLAEIFCELQTQGANNINLVTGTHYTPHIIDATRLARGNGLTIPIVYNTSGYETGENIERLRGTVDIYLPDFKYSDTEKGKKYSNAPNYTEYALGAIAKMVEQVGKPCFDDNGIMQRGVIVRHMVLPGNVKASKAAVRLIYDAFGDNVYISIMKQYTPMPHVMAYGDDYRELKRRLTTGEYNSVVNYALDIGVKNAFMQVGDNASESFIPEFNNTGV